MYEQGSEFGERQSIEERWALSEVHHINRVRNLDGTHNPLNLEAIKPNLRTHVQEAVMPFAISSTEQEYREDRFWWMDQTSEDVARSGYEYHQAQAALARVDIEVKEAIEVEEELRPGFVKIIISPRMSDSDASKEVAKKEHLADDDQIRTQMLTFDEFGNIAGKNVESLLIRDIPLPAWVSMLRDPNNFFGKSVEIENEDSALGVLGAHSQLVIEANLLPNGVLGVAEAVVPYIEDLQIRKVVEAQIEQFKNNQLDLNAIAQDAADIWIDFEVELADSLHLKYATDEVVSFIGSLEKQWHSKFLELLKDHIDLDTGQIVMSEKLAAQLELARRNTLWVAAGVSSKNEYILSRLNEKVARKVADNEATIRQLKQIGGHQAEVAQLVAENSRVIANHNIPVGQRGCSGLAIGAFGDEDHPTSEIFKTNSSSNSENEESPWEFKKGRCVVKSCKTRGTVTMVGPCGVCKSCQAAFDQGHDPTKLPERTPDPHQEIISISSLLIELANRDEAIDKHKQAA